MSPGIPPLETELENDPDYLDRLLTVEQAAAFLNLRPRTLNKWRVIGGGPAYIAISNRAIRYRRRELVAWANERWRRSTSDAGKGASHD